MREDLIEILKRQERDRRYRAIMENLQRDLVALIDYHNRLLASRTWK